MSTVHSPLATAEVEMCPTSVQTALTYLDAYLHADGAERAALEEKLRNAYQKIGKA